MIFVRVSTDIFFRASLANSLISEGRGSGNRYGFAFLNLGIQYIILEYFLKTEELLPNTFSIISFISLSGIMPKVNERNDINKEILQRSYNYVK